VQKKQICKIASMIFQPIHTLERYEVFNCVNSMRKIFLRDIVVQLNIYLCTYSNFTYEFRY